MSEEGKKRELGRDKKDEKEMEERDGISMLFVRGVIQCVSLSCLIFKSCESSCFIFSHLRVFFSFLVGNEFILGPEGVHMSPKKITLLV